MAASQVVPQFSGRTDGENFSLNAFMLGIFFFFFFYQFGFHLKVF